MESQKKFMQQAPTTSGSRQWTMEIPGRGMLFKYNRNEMIDEFAKQVSSDEFPFNHGESKACEYYTRKTLQPQYGAIPRSTLKRRTIKLYESKNYELVEMLNFFNSRVSITTDIWFAPQHLVTYMCNSTLDRPQLVYSKKNNCF